MITYAEIQANRREARMRRYQRLGNLATALIIVVILCSCVAVNRPVDDVYVSTAQSENVNKLGGL